MSEDYNESSEQTDDTPVVEEDSSQESSEGAEAQEAAAEKQTEENIPLNNPKNPYYERFTELTTQNREFKGQLGQYDQTIRQLQQEMAILRQSQAPVKEKEPAYKPILDHLETIDPNFAKFQRDLIDRTESLSKRAEVAEVLQKRLDAMETRDFQTQAVNRFNSLLETNKVPDTLRPRYEREIRIMAADLESQGEKLGVKDVDKLFRAVHEDYSKFLEDIRRAERASYVKAKRSDNTPAPVTGGAAVTPGSKPIRADDNESLIKYLAKGLREAKNV